MELALYPIFSKFLISLVLKRSSKTLLQEHIIK